MYCNLKQILKDKGKSGYRLAQELEIDAQHIYNWTNNKCLPSPKNIDRVCGHLNISLNELFTLEVVTTLFILMSFPIVGVVFG